MSAPNRNSPLTNTVGQSRRALTLDVEKYQKILDAPELTPNDRIELLQALWAFVLAFMDMGYEVKSLEDCGQNAPDANVPGGTHAAMLSCDNTPIQITFASATGIADKEAS